MVSNLYSIRDLCIGFNTPTSMLNEMVAKRSFRQIVERDPNGKDLQLFKVGTFNDETGEIIPQPPELVSMESEE